MQHDDVIWGVINQGFCSFKVKTETTNFCKNKYNLTGLCNRSSCPLANSRYATVREEEGRCYLYMKTIERAHTPKNMWEKVKLSKSYPKALEQISQQLQFWPNFLVHKAKQRLTKIHQYLIRMRRLKLKVRPKLVGIYNKIEKREEKREYKAAKAAHIEDAIKQEILQRIQQGVYGEEAMLNYQSKAFEAAISEVGTPDKEPEIRDDELDSDHEEEEEEEEEEEDDEKEDGTGVTEFVEAYDDDIVDQEDLEELQGQQEVASSSKDATPPAAKKSKKAKGRPAVELEYEEEGPTRLRH